MPPGARADFAILATDHWRIDHRADSALPGYLIVGAREPTNDLSALSAPALAELGSLLAAAQRALTAILAPEHLYVGRYGHTGGHAFHFHIIPICRWVKESFFADPRYRVLERLATVPTPGETDGAELTLYVWREFCERPDPPAISGPTVEEVITRLKAALAGAGQRERA